MIMFVASDKCIPYVSIKNDMDFTIATLGDRIEGRFRPLQAGSCSRSHQIERLAHKRGWLPGIY